MEEIVGRRTSDVGRMGRPCVRDEWNVRMFDELRATFYVPRPTVLEVAS